MPQWMHFVRRGRSAVAAVLIVLAAAATAVAASPSPRIVNGSETSAYPSVGALLMQDSIDPTQLDGLCSGTLIGCRTFLTAAHCLCPEETDTAAGCLAAGTTDPAILRVALPNGGILTVDSVAIDPAYSFAEHGDVGIVHLAAPAAGIAPSPINLQGRLADGSHATIVGFGSTGGPPFQSSDYGVKRAGKVTTGGCPDGVASDAHICWSYEGIEASTCAGDSGGPLFADFGAGLVVAGITSGGESRDCSPPDQVFDTDVYVARSWIATQLEGDTTAACGDLPALGADGTSGQSASAELSDSRTELSFVFTVPPSTGVLRVVINGQEYGGFGFERPTNDFDLFLRSAETPSGTFDCSDTTPGTYGDCTITHPRAGDWEASVELVQGEGTVQLTVTTFSDQLASDANCDERVTAADLVALARLIGNDAPPACEHVDANGDQLTNAADQPSIIAALFM